MPSSKVLPYKGEQTGLPNTITDGSIYFCTDTKNIILDHSNSRVVFNGNNDYDRLAHNQSCKAASANAGSLSFAIGASTLIGYVPSYGGYQTLYAGTSIDLLYPILWGTGNVSTNSTFTNAYEAYPSCTLRNNMDDSSWTGTQYSMAFLVGTISDNIFTCDPAEPITTTLPNSANGKYYIPLGQMHSVHQIVFRSSNKLYVYEEGALRPVELAAVNTDRLPSIPIAKGGTGATTASAARTNLEITPANIGAATTSHTHAASDITSGTFDIARVPTGNTATTVALGNHTHSDYQETLVSGTNIKTVNGLSLLGDGNISISTGGTALTNSEIDNAVDAAWA